MWKAMTVALFGALIGLIIGTVQFPEWESTLFAIASVTGGLFVMSFSQSILEK